MTWKQLTERDCREWKLSAIDPQDRDTWRSGVRSAMHAASVTWKGAHCCGYCPCTCTLIKNPMMMMMIMVTYSSEVLEMLSQSVGISATMPHHEIKHF